MKSCCLKVVWRTALLLVLLSLQSLWGQNNAQAIRVAIISEQVGLSTVSDLLTVELSKKAGLQLMEREQIAKVYREQGLSAANRDFLKLGQVLGADGLLLLEPTSEGTNQFLTARLLAVKPGVIIGAVRSSWPVEDVTGWSRWLANHFDPLFPKLGVLVRDAIPISVVNLRSAVRSREAQELERQLTLLAIERLTRERQLFVLERRRMELLSGEKELQAMGESEFWNGSYLLEGVIDRDGSSRETVTVSARLLPPRGGSPQSLEVSGSRTNLSEVVSRLAAKIMVGLKLGGNSAPWNPADEARKYFEEATWALKWGMIPEAQASAESAWALGKQDLEGAVVRVKSYVPSVAPDTSSFRFGTTYNSTGKPSSVMRDLAAERPVALVTDERVEGQTTVLSYLSVKTLPDPKHIDLALRALGLYENFSRTLPPGEPNVNSSWYAVGIEALQAASQVLQYFHLVPESQSPVSENLTQLRALCRDVATWISKSPSVSAAYWVGDRIATHDELCHTIQESQNIFRCKLDWGCFWQEKPEDGVAVYRELVNSAVFSYLHERFWRRPLERPRLTAWNSQDRQRIPQVWQAFLQELNSSTNFLLSMEAKALELADARNDQAKEAAYHSLMAVIYTNSEAIVSHNVELLYLNWGIGTLIGGDGLATQTKERLGRLFGTEDGPKLEALSREYWRKSAEQKLAKESAGDFEAQKNYLRANTQYEPAKFTDTFRFRRYSKTQAAELQPLLATYKSNLLAKTEVQTGREQAQTRSAITRVGLMESQVNRILNPAPASPVATETGLITNRAPGAVRAQPDAQARLESPTTSPPGQTNRSIAQPLRPVPAPEAILVKQFIGFPQDRLKEGKHEEKISNLRTEAYRFQNGRLWLDLRYHYEYLIPRERVIEGVHQNRSAAAGLNLDNNSWEIIHYPEAKAPPNRAPWEYFELTGDALYLSGWDYLRRYDFVTRRWDTTTAPWQKNTQLYSVGSRLYAGNDEAIIEALDGGRTTRILASTRRRPAASALDSVEALRDVRLFAGPGGSLRASIRTGIFAWDGRDWTGAFNLPLTRPAEVFADGTVFSCAAVQQPASLWLLQHGQATAELGIKQDSGRNLSFYPAAKVAASEPGPIWRTTIDFSSGEVPMTLVGSNLYFLVEHCDWTNQAGRRVAVEKEGRHANLVCLDRAWTNAIVVPLKFDLARGPLPDRRQAPVTARPGVAPVWLAVTPKLLLIGQAAVPGVWALSRSEIDNAKGKELARQQSMAAQEVAAVQKKWQVLLSKFDRNRNGTIDGQERQAALDEPAFLEFERPRIDANGNGWLDADELAGFDANKNRTLEQNEETAVQNLQKLLAGILLDELDQDGDAHLNRTELSAAYPAATRNSAATDLSFSDTNRDQKLSRDELTEFLKRRTDASLQAGNSPRSPTPMPLARPIGGPAGAMTFKQRVEARWNNAPNQPGVVPGSRPGPTGLPVRPVQRGTNQ